MRYVLAWFPWIIMSGVCIYALELTVCDILRDTTWREVGKKAVIILGVSTGIGLWVIWCIWSLNVILGKHP